MEILKSDLDKANAQYAAQIFAGVIITGLNVQLRENDPTAVTAAGSIAGILAISITVSNIVIDNYTSWQNQK